MIKLKIKPEVAVTEKANEVVNAFIDACCKMDPSVLEPFMNEEDVFEDKEKWEFLTHFRNKLWNINDVPGEKLYVKLGKCLGCKCYTDLHAHEFYDNKGEFYFAYMIEEDESGVVDIYECHMSSGFKSSKTIPEWYGKG